LHEFVKGVLDEACQHPPANAGAAGSMEECVHQFKRDLNAIGCERCVVRRIGSSDPSKIKGAICDGKNDIANLNFGALCWETFAELFKFSVQITQQLYSSIVQSDETEQLNIELQTRITTEPGFGARTVFPDTDKAGNRSAVVQLTLPVEDFDDSYYLRLPYYIFHEVFVHAPESWTSVGKRQPTNERCAFGEGFVDAAAVRVLIRALEGGELLTPVDRPFFEHFMNETEKAHHRRADLAPVERGSYKQRDKAAQDAADARDDGMRLFKRLAERENPQLADEAIRIALCVNLLPLEPSERIDFMTKLDRASANRAAITERYSNWLNSLRNAANRGDLKGIKDLIGPVRDF